MSILCGPISEPLSLYSHCALRKVPIDVRHAVIKVRQYKRACFLSPAGSPIHPTDRRSSLLTSACPLPLPSFPCFRRVASHVCVICNQSALRREAMQAWQADKIWACCSRCYEVLSSSFGGRNLFISSLFHAVFFPSFHEIITGRARRAFRKIFASFISERALHFGRRGGK